MDIRHCRGLVTSSKCKHQNYETPHPNSVSKAGLRRLPQGNQFLKKKIKKEKKDFFLKNSVYKKQNTSMEIT
jgi:hypothetical protein